MRDTDRPARAGDDRHLTCSGDAPGRLTANPVGTIAGTLPPQHPGMTQLSTTTTGSKPW
jgi:hypothetical protein